MRGQRAQKQGSYTLLFTAYSALTRRFVARRSTAPRPSLRAPFPVPALVLPGEEHRGAGVAFLGFGAAPLRVVSGKEVSEAVLLFVNVVLLDLCLL